MLPPPLVARALEEEDISILDFTGNTKKKKQPIRTHHFIDIDEYVARQLGQTMDPVQGGDCGAQAPDEHIQGQVIEELWGVAVAGR